MSDSPEHSFDDYPQVPADRWGVPERTLPPKDEWWTETCAHGCGRNACMSHCHGDYRPYRTCATCRNRPHPDLEQNLSDKSDTATETRRVTESRHEPGECNDPSRENATSSHAEASKPYLTPQRDSTRTCEYHANREVLPPIPHDHVERAERVISEINPSNDIECDQISVDGSAGMSPASVAGRGHMPVPHVHKRPESAPDSVISRDEKVSEATQNPVVITESVINDDSYKRIGELQTLDREPCKMTNDQDFKPSPDEQRIIDWLLAMYERSGHKIGPEAAWYKIIAYRIKDGAHQMTDQQDEFGAKDSRGGVERQPVANPLDQSEIGATRPTLQGAAGAPPPGYIQGFVDGQEDMRQQIADTLDQVGVSDKIRGIADAIREGRLP